MTDKQVLNALLRCETHLKYTRQGYVQFSKSGFKGSEWKAALAALNLAQAELQQRLVPRWAKLGPVTRGGISLLDFDLTHLTTGLDLFPAVDLAWGAGIDIIAPEGCVVFLKDSSASPGEAVYLKGDSRLVHWVGHITRDWPLGHRFEKGDKIADVLDQSGTDHCHWAVNAEAYLGKGNRLKYGRTGNGPNYTHGSPTIRRQLEAAAL